MMPDVSPVGGPFKAHGRVLSDKRQSDTEYSLIEGRRRESQITIVGSSQQGIGGNVGIWDGKVQLIPAYTDTAQDRPGPRALQYMVTA